MMSFLIHLADLQHPCWRWSHDRWTNGRSWIKPVDHPLVDARIVTAPDRAQVTIQENRHRWGGDHLTLDLQPGLVRLTAGPFGTCPLYLTADGDALHGSWWLPDLQTHLSADRLCARAVTRALTRQHRYSSDTLFTNMRRLTERATATFSHAGCAVAYPPPASHVLQARELHPDVDAVQAFDSIVRELVADVPFPAEATGVELSGGADSANVALALVQSRGGVVNSFGLVLDDEQRWRRTAIADRFGLADSAIDANEHHPFGPTGVRGHSSPHDPTGSYYCEAFDALRDTVVRASIRVMFTGLGGDEICSLRTNERSSSPVEPVGLPRWLGPAAREALPNVDRNLAPVSALPVPTLMAFGIHNPGYVRRNIWPVAPLAHPAVVRFCEQLPPRWRRAKNLLRTRLRRCGLVDDVVSPSRPETFTDLLQTGLQQHGIDQLDQMMRHSILVDTGYVDAADLARSIAYARATGRVPSQLADPIAIEIGLRSLTATNDHASR